MLGAACRTPGPQSECRVSTPVSCSLKELELPSLRKGGPQPRESHVQKSSWGGPEVLELYPHPLLLFSQRGPSLDPASLLSLSLAGTGRMETVGAQASSESRARCSFHGEGAKSLNPFGSS